MQVAARQARRVDGTGSPALVLRAHQALAVAEATSADGLPALLAEALAGERPQTNVVVVSTRPVDLSDASRFAELHARSELQAWPARALTLTPDDANWSVYFRGPDE
jgi:hypothetical protein